MTKDIKRAIALDIVNTVLIMNPERHVTTSFSACTIQVVLYYNADEKNIVDDLEWLNDSYGFNGEAKIMHYNPGEDDEFSTIEINQ